MRNTSIAFVSSLLNDARKQFAAKQLEQAEIAVRKALEMDSANVIGNHLLGVIAGRTGRFDLAEQLLRKAANLDPRDANIQIDLGTALGTAGRLDAAAAAYREALRLRPDDEQALNNLGVTLQSAKRFEESIEVFRKLAKMHPDRMQLHLSLLSALRQVGRLEEAAEAAKQFATAMPDCPEAYMEQGISLNDTGHLAAAIQSYQRAIDFRPSFAAAYNNLAVTLREAGLLSKAIVAARRAIELQPDYTEAFFNIAITLKDLGRHSEAMEAFREALRNRSDLPGAYNGLGNILYDCGHFDDAVAHYRKALALNPGYVEAHDNLVYQLNFHPRYTAKQIYDEHAIWNEQRALPLAKFIKPHTNERDPERRLKIGYVSPDFKDHVVGLNMLPLFRNHDRDRFRITCFYNSAKHDAITEQFRQLADSWHSINKLGDEDMSALVRREEIDILVDLALHMNGSRLLAFARKPAPVQVTFAGYPGTTGLTTMDYRLTDPYLDPPGMNDAFYSEKSVRLPHSFWCYMADGDDPKVKPLPALERGFVVFGCLNNHVKVNKDVLALWERVLRAVPNSKLLLQAPHGEHRQHVSSMMALEEGRVQFVGRLKRTAYLETYDLIDVCLDTFPYNGHTTSLDSFWMGVPVVTLCGEPGVSRAGFSQASNLGLTELVAKTPDEFVRVAVELAEDFDRLAKIRTTLRERMCASPLMDAAGFAKGIESAYRGMWREWCRAGDGRAGRG
jgi:predicted O-linked N-acetylglucosamine transferase (SPINDLY family)